MSQGRQDHSLKFKCSEESDRLSWESIVYAAVRLPRVVTFDQACRDKITQYYTASVGATGHHSVGYYHMYVTGFHQGLCYVFIAADSLKLSPAFSHWSSPIPTKRSIKCSLISGSYVFACNLVKNTFNFLLIISHHNSRFYTSWAMIRIRECPLFSVP